MSSSREGGILLNDGRVFFLGGNAPVSGNAQNTLEIYNPVNEQFTVTGTMLNPRQSAMKR